MAYYYSIHTGPEIDAAASMLDEIEDVRVETGQNKDLAVSSANQASIDADRAEAAQGTFDGDISAAEQARDEAEGARDLSQQYAGESDNARAQAVVARNGAEQAESNAAQSALDAADVVLGNVFDDTAARADRGWTSQKIDSELASKVNTVSGKTLSENDYTTAEKNSLAGKQDELVSGTNIKTLGGETLLGSGDIPIAAIATSAQIQSLTTDNTVTPAKVSDALGAITPDGSSWTPTWDTFITAKWQITGNRTLANPTGGIPGTTRVVTIKAISPTERTISFGAYFKGELPEVKVTDTAFVTLFIYCVTAIDFLVSDKGWTS